MNKKSLFKMWRRGDWREPRAVGAWCLSLFQRTLSRLTSALTCLSPGRARSGKPKAYTGFYSNEKKRPENASQCETRALKRSRLCRLSGCRSSSTHTAPHTRAAACHAPHTVDRSIDRSLYNYIDLYIEKDTGTRGPDWMVSFTPLVDQHDVPAELRSEWRLQLS